MQKLRRSAAMLLTAISIGLAGAGFVTESSAQIGGYRVARFVMTDGVAVQQAAARVHITAA
jgi:hypothetical protein